MLFRGITLVLAVAAVGACKSKKVVDIRNQNPMATADDQSKTASQTPAGDPTKETVPNQQTNPDPDSKTSTAPTSTPANKVMFTNTNPAPLIGDAKGVAHLYTVNGRVYGAHSGSLANAIISSITGGESWVQHLVRSSTFTAVATSGTTLYASSLSGLSISTDEGATWTLKTTANGLGSDNINFVHASGNKVYAATNTGLSISLDGGATWTNKNLAEIGANPSIFGVRAVNTSGSTVYVGTDSGLYVSTNDGATFVKNIFPTDGADYVLNIAVAGQTLYVSTIVGLQISTNGGMTWTSKSKANGLAASSINAVYVLGPKMYVATTAGLSISTDGGATWVTRTTENGLGSNDVSSVVAIGDVIYVATTKGISVSKTGGF